MARQRAIPRARRAGDGRTASPFIRALLRRWPAVFLLLGPVGPARAQLQIVPHCTFGSLNADDGNPARDADGTANGVVVWRAGVVHVIGECSNNIYSIPADGRLVIEPGAIVKVTGPFAMDQNGRVTNWAAGGGTLDGPIVARGATITDIRDDSVGGDTNQDGGASSVCATCYPVALRLGFSDRSVLEGNTIKFAWLYDFGDATIAGNTFVQMAGMRQDRPNPARGNTYDASPLIRGNTIDGTAILDLRGMTPVVENNVIRGGSAPLEIGPRRFTTTSPWSPQAGTTLITGNRLEDGHGLLLANTTSGGVTGLSQIAFHALIQDNVLQGGGSMSLAVDAFARVVGNEVVGPTSDAVSFSSHAASTPRLVVQHNRFGLRAGPFGSGCTAFSRWSTAGFVNAEHNYWGDPSGPLDASSADDLFNGRGRGRCLGDGIDYAPFVGARPDLGDEVHVTVTSSAPAPLAVDAAVTFTVDVHDLRLNTASGADLHAIVRDEAGDVLGSRTMRVGLSHTSAAFAPITVTVGRESPYLVVEAVLVPDGSRRETVSNQTRYRVDRSRGTFDLWSLGVEELPSGGFPRPFAGRPIRVRLRLGYTWTAASATGPGTIEVYGSEVEGRTRSVLQTFPAGGGALASVPAPTGTNQTVSIDLPELRPGLWDARLRPRLRGKIVLKDDHGVVLDEQETTVDIERPTIRIRRLQPVRTELGIDLTDRAHFIASEPFRALLEYTVQGTTPQDVAVADVTVYGVAEATSTVGVRILDERLDLTAGDHSGTLTVNRGFPAGTRLALAVASLDYAEGETLVSSDSVFVEVHENVTTETRDVPTGPSQVALGNLDLFLTLTSNQQAGRVTAEAVRAPFTDPRGKPFADAPAAVPAEARDYAAQRFIPLNRFWSLYGTLAEGRFAGRVAFRYAPADFPSDPAFREDSLVVAALNPLSRELEALPSVLDRAARTVTADYTTFFQTYVVAAKRTVLVTAHAPEGRPSAFAVEPPYPNPARGETVIAFSVPAPAAVTVRVYDLLGREVATLLDGMKAPGRHTVAWDGRDGGGAVVPGGVYLLRVQAGRTAETRTAVRLR